MAPTESPLPSRDFLEGRIAAGEKPSLDELLRYYHNRLLLWIHFKVDPSLNPRLDPEDILQEASIVAHRRFPEMQLRRLGDFLAWMHEIIENCIQNMRRHLERQMRHAHKEVPLDEFRSSSSDATQLADQNAVSPSRIFERESRVREFYKVLAELPATQIEAILLVKVLELGVAEAAQRMGLSRPQVSLALTRGAATLRRLVEQRKASFPYLFPGG